MLGLLADDTNPNGPHGIAIQGFMLTYPNASSGDVISFLKTYSGDERIQVAQELIGAGVDQSLVSSSLAFLATSNRIKDASWLWGTLSLVSAAASGYHGYRRNKSVGWGVTWFVLGALFPVVTPVIALAEGFGKPKS